MDNERKAVLEKAFSMSQENRAFIADRLIDSLDSTIDYDVEAAWQREIQKRIAAAEKGEAEFIP